MRKCFRMKLMSNNHKQEDIDAGGCTAQSASDHRWSTLWKNQPNYVAKLYMDDTELSEVLDLFKRDLVMQMKAKQLAMQFNALHPPKKIEMVSARSAVIPVTDGWCGGSDRCLLGSAR